MFLFGTKNWTCFGYALGQDVIIVFALIAEKIS